MLLTKQNIVDEIAYMLYGGLPPNDRAVSDNMILRSVNNYIAEAAMKSAFQTNNVDQVVSADDVFRLTYTNLTLSTDTSNGLKYFLLPVQPVGLPSNRSFTVYPPANRGGRSSGLFKPISAADVSKTRSLPGIKKVFHFVENGAMYFIDTFQIMATYTALNLSIISSGANSLSAILNLPDDMIAALKIECLGQLRPMISLQDTDPLPAQDSPQPR